MALNSNRDSLGQSGLRAFHNQSSFKPEADESLGRFQSLRDDLERQVKRGDLTIKVAREKAEAGAEKLKAELRSRVESFSSVPRVFLDRLIESGNARKRSREHMSIEGLQRETNKLIRQTLVEQQLQNRASEFEGKTYLRTLSGGQPAPTLHSLLAFHEMSRHAGDESAVEWGRRQLEGMRARVADPADIRRIDLACDRSDAVNPRLIATYMETLKERESDAATMEDFVGNALESRDANACVAAFLMARDAAGGTAVRWVRDVLNGIGEFPDAAVETLRSVEAEARGADAESARAQADYAIAIAESQIKFAGLDAPSEDELARQQRVRAKPVARLGESIGLALDRRGFTPDELEAALEDHANQG